MCVSSSEPSPEDICMQDSTWHLHFLKFSVYQTESVNLSLQMCFFSPKFFISRNSMVFPPTAQARKPWILPQARGHILPLRGVLFFFFFKATRQCLTIYEVFINSIGWIVWLQVYSHSINFLLSSQSDVLKHVPVAALIPFNGSPLSTG